MADGILPSLARVRLADLITSEGIASESYNLAASAITQSLAQFSAAVLELSPPDAALLRTSLHSLRLFFHSRPRDGDGPHCYDYRPGFPLDTALNDLPPPGVPELFPVLGRASRDIVDAVGFSLNLASSTFTEVLDSVPLRSGETSSSLLSACCYSRPSLEASQTDDVGSYEDEHSAAVFSGNEEHVDKGLVTLLRSDKGGLYVKDLHGNWTLVDGDLGPLEIVAYSGVALYQLTDGCIGPAIYKVETRDMQGSTDGRCSLAFKLVPKSAANVNCSENRATANGSDTHDQLHIPVEDLMQRSQLSDQPFSKNDSDLSLKSNGKRKCNSTTSKQLPPSKRFRLEAQRVLKERVQDIADKKGIKLRFCNLKECEGHMREQESPCGTTRLEIGWPPDVPFVHPHDLPNKAKLKFLEAYEPGWSDTHQDIEGQSP